MKRLVKRLLDKSQEAFIMALEIYNKPTIHYRIEGFCFFFCNAWELLLKAKIVDDTRNERTIYYKKKRNQKRKSLSLKDSLKKIFSDDKDPIRRNVEDIAIIRDEAVHLIVKELEYVYSGLFQSGVLNYTYKLEEWFDRSILDKIDPAMLTLVSDISGEDPIIIKKKYGIDVLKFFEQETDRLKKSEEELNNLSYRIPIEYRLALTKSQDKADITFSSGKKGDYVAIPIEVPKDIDRTHPYLFREVIARVRDILGEDRFNQYDLQSIIFKEKIKGQAKYHYLITKPETHRYSEELVNYIVEKIKRNKSYLNNVREFYSKRNKRSI